MSDLISRQAAIDAVNDIASGLHARKRLDEEYIASWCAETIERLPSVQPEVIRCKDCAKREYCRTSTVWAVPPSDDWYCADAEPYKGEQE